jgi:hypothetical protein
MARRTYSDLDFGVGEDGGLKLRGYDPNQDDLEVDLDDFVDSDEEEEDDEELEDDDEEGAEEDGEEEEEDGEEDGEEDEDDDDEPPARRKSSAQTVSRLRAEVRDLKRSIPQLIASNIAQALQTYLPGRQQQEVDELDELEEDAEISNVQMIKMLDKRLDKKIDKQFDKYKPALTQAELNGKFQKAINKYGQKFTEVIPQVAQIMLDADITDVDKAYGAYLRMEKAANKRIAERRPNRMQTKLSKRGVRMVPAQKGKVIKIRREEDLSPVEKLIRHNKRQRLDADAADSVGEMLPERRKFRAPKDGNDSDVFDASFNLGLMKTAVGQRRKGRRAA